MTASASKRKRTQKGWNGDDDDVDFQDAKSGDTAACSYQPPNLQYMGRKLKMRFRLEDTGKIQWFDGQILNYDPSSGQYGVYFPSDHQTIYIHPDDKDVKYLE